MALGRHFGCILEASVTSSLGGVVEVSMRHLGGVFEASGRCQGGIGDASGRGQGGFGEVLERRWALPGRPHEVVYEALGKSQRGVDRCILKVSGRHQEDIGNES